MTIESFLRTFASTVELLDSDDPRVRHDALDSLYVTGFRWSELVAAILEARRRIHDHRPSPSPVVAAPRRARRPLVIDDDGERQGSGV